MKKISVIPYAGLCNRIRAIASAAYVANYFQTNLEIYWNKTSDCSVDFGDIFTPISLSYVTVIENKSLLHKIPANRNLQIPALFQKLRYGQTIYNYNKKDGDILKAIKECDSLLLCSCHSMCQHIDLKTLFRPTHSISAEIEDKLKSFSSDTVGVHIRRTDHVLSIKNSPVEKFIGLMTEEIKKSAGVKFYVASDDSTVKQQLQNAFPDRVLVREATLNRNTEEGMRDAVIDLFLLSKCKYIIGSMASSYSEIAAELGGIELRLAK